MRDLNPSQLQKSLDIAKFESDGFSDFVKWDLPSLDQ